MWFFWAGFGLCVVSLAGVLFCERAAKTIDDCRCDKCGGGCRARK